MYKSQNAQNFTLTHPHTEHTIYAFKSNVQSFCFNFASYKKASFIFECHLNLRYVCHISTTWGRQHVTSPDDTLWHDRMCQIRTEWSIDTVCCLCEMEPFFMCACHRGAERGIYLPNLHCKIWSYSSDVENV